VLLAALAVVVAVVPTSLAAVGLLGAARVAQRTAVGALLLGAGALLVGGAAAAVLGARLPSGLLGFLGMIPVLRGLGRLTSVRFREDETSSPATGGELRGAVLARLADPAAAYLPLAGTRAAPELLEASAVLAALAVVAAILVGRLAARPAAVTERVRRAGRALSGWALVAVGAFLLVEGGAFAWLLPR
jgi:cadmium resistance protein CadD (predicted permease)